MENVIITYPRSKLLSTLTSLVAHISHPLPSPSSPRLLLLFLLLLPPPLFFSSSSPLLLLFFVYFFLLRYADAAQRVPSHFDVYAAETRDAATVDADASGATGATDATDATGATDAAAGATNATGAMDGMRKRARWVGRSFRSTYRVSALPVSGGAARLVFFVCAATESGLTRSLQTAPSITVDLV